MKNYGRFRVLKYDEGKFVVTENNKGSLITLCQTNEMKFADVIAVALDVYCKPGPSDPWSSDMSKAPRDGVRATLVDRDKDRPIQVHCMALLIGRSTGITDGRAVDAAYDVFDYANQPKCYPPPAPTEQPKPVSEIE